MWRESWSLLRSRNPPGNPNAMGEGSFLKSLFAFILRELDEPIARWERTPCNDLWSDHFATCPLLLLRTSTMTSLVRPTLTSILLCCVIALGHAPAWMHVSSCAGHCGHASVDRGVCPTEVVHSCGCHSHGCDVPPHHGEEPGYPPAHDSDTCHICQSLAAPVGLVDLSGPTLTSDAVCEFAARRLTSVVAQPSISWPPLRGPPVAGVFSVG